MRTSIAALAVIRRWCEGRPQWLVQWNQAWQCLALIGGHKHADESFRDCVVREAAEELHLVPGADFCAAAKPLARLEYTAWSARAQADTAYTVEMFDVELHHIAAERQVSADPCNRWITSEEVLSGRTTEGQSLSESLRRFLPYLVTDEASSR